MGALAKYDAARGALAEAKTFDEVKDIRDKAEALRAYARMANDLQLEIDAAEIRVRAERRLGEMIKETELHKGGRPKENKTGGQGEPVPLPTLASLKINKSQSRRAQRVAGIGERAFEVMVNRLRERMAERGPRVSLDLMRDEDKKARRARREAELGAKQCALPATKFGVILADPEWRFEPWSRETGMDRSAENHYPTSVTQVIASRPVQSIAADDCVLFLWATIPMLPQALMVMAAWGFDYKSHWCWVKDRIGTGYWGREQHELLLIGSIGKPPAPAMGSQHSSVINAKRGTHSSKPEVFLDMIEQYFPTMPKIELNRRGPARDGWLAWGNESESQPTVTDDRIDALSALVNQNP